MNLIRLIFCVFGLAVARSVEQSPEELMAVYLEEYRFVQRTSNRTENFDAILEKVRPSFHDFLAPDLTDKSAKKFSLICMGCQLLVKMFIEERRKGKTEAEIAKMAYDQCVLFKIQPPNVCKGIIESNTPILLYILDHRADLTEKVFCALLLQESKCGKEDKYFEFSVKVDQTSANPINESKVASLASTKPSLKVVHLTDIHYDPNYVVGANADCGEPTCCRESQGIATSFQNAAGYYGAFRNCDTSLLAIQDVLTNIKERHPDVDYIYFTGDVVDHGIWETSVEYNKNSISTIRKLFVDTFPGIPVYCALGNHEAHPLNLFAPNDVSDQHLNTQWLYDFVADEWGTWLPESTKETIKTGGYYSVEVQKGLRLIVLNNNDCYVYNFWILYNPQYLAKQLQWFHDTLLEAESRGEMVHIFAHVPSGDATCLKVWSREYRRILDRFWNTVVTQFNGHTHFDTFNVVYSQERPNVAIGQAWNGGSVTTYTDLNRNYVVYSVDQESFEILDAVSYYYNLTAANLNPDLSPEWQTSYSLKADFGLSDLSPASLDGLVTRLAKQPELLKQYWQGTVKQSDVFVGQGCNKDCLKAVLCDTVINEPADRRKCTELIKLLKNN